jgi:hypothetical protein
MDVSKNTSHFGPLSEPSAPVVTRRDPKMLEIPWREILSFLL